MWRNANEEIRAWWYVQIIKRTVFYPSEVEFIWKQKRKGAALSLTFRCVGPLGATFYFIDLFYSDADVQENPPQKADALPSNDLVLV